MNAAKLVNDNDFEGFKILEKQSYFIRNNQISSNEKEINEVKDNLENLSLNPITKFY